MTILQAAARRTNDGADFSSLAHFAAQHQATRLYLRATRLYLRFDPHNRRPARILVATVRPAAKPVDLVVMLRIRLGAAGSATES